MSFAAKPGYDPYKDGLALAAEGRHAEAIAALERALERRPNDVRVLFALGHTAAAVGHVKAAESFYRRVLASEPGRLEALVNLANLLRKEGRYDEVVALIKPALERDPAQAELWLTLGSALREAGDARTAEIFYREALRLSPESAAALGNLADLLADQGDVAAALALYERALAAEPENAQARLNRAILFLLEGDLRTGWADYEYRLKIKTRALIADHGLPLWDGRMRTGLKLLVTAEQGIGDQIMFASLVPELAQAIATAGGRLMLEAEKRLKPLFARSFPDVSVRAAILKARGAAISAHYPWLGELGGADAAIPMGSLPRLMRTDLASFPVPHAYLKSDARERRIWSRWLRAQGEGPYVGLCWRSGRDGGLRNLQYAPLSEWAAFLKTVRGTLIVLQYDLKSEERDRLEQMSGRTLLIPPGLDQKEEIDRTAGLIASLDWVVSAPTAVAWLSAALGVPTLKILYNNSWTAFGRDHEPFAPAARCIMPRRAGDWRDAFAKAAAQL